MVFSFRMSGNLEPNAPNSNTDSPYLLSRRTSHLVSWSNFANHFAFWHAGTGGKGNQTILTLPLKTSQIAQASSNFVISDFIYRYNKGGVENGLPPMNCFPPPPICIPSTLPIWAQGEKNGSAPFSDVIMSLDGLPYLSRSGSSFAASSCQS